MEACLSVFVWPGCAQLTGHLLAVCSRQSKMEEMRTLLNTGAVRSNFPNYGDGAMSAADVSARRVTEMESVNSLAGAEP